MQKLRRINKEKDFWEGLRKRKYPEDQLPAKPNHPAVPAVWACVGLCAVFAGRVRKHPPVPMPAPAGLFLRGFWKGGVFESVWVIRG